MSFNQQFNNCRNSSLREVDFDDHGSTGAQDYVRQSGFLHSQPMPSSLLVPPFLLTPYGRDTSFFAPAYATNNSLPAPEISTNMSSGIPGTAPSHGNEITLPNTFHQVTGFGNVGAGNLTHSTRSETTHMEMMPQHISLQLERDDVMGIDTICTRHLLEGHTEPRRFQCHWKGCLNTTGFNKVTCLRRHVETLHIAPGAFICSYHDCSKSFNRKEHLKNHERAMHAERGDFHNDSSCCFHQ